MILAFPGQFDLLFCLQSTDQEDTWLSLEYLTFTCVRIFELYTQMETPFSSLMEILEIKLLETYSLTWGKWCKPDQSQYSAISYQKFHSLSIRVSIKNDNKFEPVREISNNMVCATSKASDQPAHTRSLIRAFASRLSIL